MNSQEILIQARALIENKDRWTQLAFARNGVGEKCSVTSPKACQWCGVGAVMRIAYLNDVSAAAAIEILNRASVRHYDGFDYGSPFSVNDALGHQEVLAMFNTAIEKAAA